MLAQQVPSIRELMHHPIGDRDQVIEVVHDVVKALKYVPVLFWDISVPFRCILPQK